METSNLACEQATSNRVEERQILMRTPVTCKSSLKLQCKVISDRLFSPVPVRLPRSSAVKSCLLLLLFLIICIAFYWFHISEIDLKQDAKAKLIGVQPIRKPPHLRVPVRIKKPKKPKIRKIRLRRIRRIRFPSPRIPRRRFGGKVGKKWFFNDHLLMRKIER